MTFKDLLDLLRARLALLIGVTLAATAAAGVVSYRMPDVYTASITMQVISTTGSATEGQLVANDIAAVLRSGKVEAQALGELGIADGSPYQVAVGASANSRVITLSVTGTDPNTISLLTLQMAADISAQAQALMFTQPLIAEGTAAPQAYVSGPPRKKYIAYAAVGGLALVLALVLVRELVRPQVRSGDEAARLLGGVPVIGRLPGRGRASTRKGSAGRDDADRSIAGANSPDTTLRTFLANIRFQSKDQQMRTLVVTSACPGEGKTETSLALARTIAASGRSVVLVEGNMRNPSLNDRFAGDRDLLGYCDVVEGKVPLSKAICRLKVPNLFYLSAGTPAMDPADLLADDRVTELLAHLQTMFDYVVYDTPAAASFVDAAVLAHTADGTIMVVRPKKLSARELMAAKEELDLAGARILCVYENRF